MRTLFGCFAAWVLIGSAQAVDWPANYIVADGSISPEGRYGVLIHDHDHLPDDPEEVAGINHLADIKGHKALARIKNARYFEGGNHMDLSVVWAADSSWCVLIYGARFGFHSIELLQPSASGVKEASLGERIRKDAGKIASAELDPFIREGAHGQIEIRVTGTSDPKGIGTKKAAFVYFRGTYDVASAAWMGVKTRACSGEESEDLSVAFEQEPEPGSETAEEKAERLDSRLNKIYTGLRHLLPAERFETLKKEQREWLAGVGKAGNPAKENSRTEARVGVLEMLLWSL